MPDRLNELLRTAVLQVCIALIAVLVLDVACYFCLPNGIARKFGGYRAVPGSGKDKLEGRAGYPKGYFVSNPARGFDLNPGAQGSHRVDGTTYAIWANSLGCFDREWQTVPAGYYYFAGDSSTWGYTPYNQKYATVFEARTNIPSIKCGVPHTGQRHEFDKFGEIVGKLGVLPKRVIVAYSSNDVANDYAYPHSTVVDGWLVDEVFLDANTYQRVQVDKRWLDEKIAESGAPRPESEAKILWAQTKTLIEQYSISAQIIRTIAQQTILALGRESVERSGGFLYRGRGVKNLYSLSELYIQGDKFRYPETEYTVANRRALAEWQADANKRGYQLTFMLVPYREMQDSVGFWTELETLMRAQGTEFIDLAEELRAMGVKADQIYWPIDGHMSPGGNKLVADILVRHFGSSVSRVNTRQPAPTPKRRSQRASMAILHERVTDEALLSLKRRCTSN